MISGYDYWNGKEYLSFCERRLEQLFKHFNKKRLKNKTILELGSGTGYFGELLEHEGAIVTSVDAREEYVLALKQKYPNRECYNIDLNKVILSLGEYDIVFAFGIIYHLENPLDFLKKCFKIAPMLFICSLVSDEFYFEENVEDKGFNQSITGKSCKLSEDYLKNSLIYVGYTKIKNITDDGSWAEKDKKRVMFIARR